MNTTQNMTDKKQFELAAKAAGIEIENMKYRIYFMSCAECSLTQPMQPCEACPNRAVQRL